MGGTRQAILFEMGRGVSMRCQLRSVSTRDNAQLEAWEGDEAGRRWECVGKGRVDGKAERGVGGLNMPIYAVGRFHVLQG